MTPCFLRIHEPQQHLPRARRWGGYYTLPAPPPGSTYSTLTPPPPSLAAAASGLFMCAGCAMNDASKGYFFGGVTLSV